MSGVAAFFVFYLLPFILFLIILLLLLLLLGNPHARGQDVDISDRLPADLADESGFADVSRFLRACADGDFLLAVGAARSDVSATSGSGFLDDFESTSDASGLTAARMSTAQTTPR